MDSMRLGRLIREKEMQFIKSHLEGASSFCLVSLSRTKVNDLNLLRRSLRKNNSRMIIVKNSLLMKVFKELRLDGLCEFIQGSTALVSIKDDIVSPSKVLVDFTKDYEGLKIRAGFMEGKVIDAKKIIEIAKLPGREILRAQVIGALKGPLVNFTGVLRNILAKFIWVLNAVKEKKEKDNQTQ